MKVNCLIWDKWNVVHIARHEVTPDEVEEICQGDHISEKGYSGRLRLVGYTQKGRALGVVLVPKGDDIFYPVTARPASRKERKKYLGTKGGEAK
ncbi:hypothetical protein A2630_00375 [Candidatus Woesebacteria bacterium RIFCSPHIGHO2_01_FULL_44_10]|uniref:Toxin n=1 Tax=Candidatus Woesebacteria bacterium RIFCSPLOWO2_01_FULL_44_14 TaxID=1802525 RepID=A0A1F8C185_9BACT|nr:MAG: hypothetical protein A2630_00375 [Candidatus Woesebacteria bacterium RIFCSPHIGHO2_01_FULL_44_10]OGM53736.1 MAG: hypothetical protein A3F62_03670 [Candidatus Woesebacteria bacterium RIFCSPHIGHO2_12_FULL_44_11]OGM70083.1 MAG: hypothetical protein A2975_03335 [Candidatus Woesebacteria bacterium RIFCSPLOWO2_01_FULL_44_14]